MFVLLSLGLSLVRALVHLRLGEQAAYDGAGKRREGASDQAGHPLRPLIRTLGHPSEKEGGPTPSCKDEKEDARADPAKDRCGTT